MNFMVKILALISDSLMLPGTILLVAMFVYSMYLLGCFFSLYLRILGSSRLSKDIIGKLDRGEKLEIGILPKNEFSLKLRQLAELNWHSVRCEKRIADFNQKNNWDLARSKFLIKIGPLMGLMLTLIPMGPALVGLANGDITSMAHNLHLAFTTTVVGIFVGAVGLITYEVKNNWYREEIIRLQYALDLERNEGDSQDEE